MAVYERNQGQLPPSSNAMPALPSRDIGSIIVRSLQNALSADSGGDDELPDKIAEGINRSDLMNGQKKGGVSQNGEGGNSKSPIDNLLKGGETARTKAYEKHLKKEEDAEKKVRREREARDRAATKAFETTLRGLSTFAQNPLKGLDNALQAGFKGLFKFGNNLMHKSLGDINKDMKKAVGVVTAPARAVGGLVKGTVTTALAVGKVVGGGVAKAVGEGGIQKAAVEASDVASEKSGKTKVAKMKGEEKGGETKQDKDKKEVKEANIEKKRDKQANAQLAETAKTNLTVGMIFGKLAALAIGLAAAAVLIPIIAGKIADLIITVKRSFKEAPASFSVMLSKAKGALMSGLYQLAGDLKWPKIGPWGGGTFLDPGLSDSEKEELATLENTDLIKDYNNAKSALKNYSVAEASANRLKEIESKVESGQKLSSDEGQLWNKRDSIRKTAEEGRKLREKIEFWEQNELVKRYNLLSGPIDKEAMVAKINAESEGKVAKIWDEHYSDLSKLTAREAADIMNAGTEKYGDALIGRLAEYVNKGGTFQAETGVEAVSRRGSNVSAELQNVGGELVHNLTVSTKDKYKRHEGINPETDLQKAVQNYHNTVNNITTATPSNMGAGPR